ncbi:GspH/FimT family pseudopilin [Steroidobacter gossypii]
MPGTRSFQRRAARSILGFTLVELMVTIAIAGILLAVAVPSFNQLMVTNRLTAQANEMVAAMNFARSEAIKRNTRISFCRASSSTATNCAATAASWRNWIVTQGDGTVVRRGVVNTFEGGISVQSTLTGDRVTFGADGLARTGTAIITNQRISICAPRDRAGRRVVLGAGSRLSTESYTGSCGA